MRPDKHERQLHISTVSIDEGVLTGIKTLNFLRGAKRQAFMNRGLERFDVYAENRKLIVHATITLIQ
jgi:hypothetical protein